MEKEEADSLTPEIRMIQIPGIPGINGVELFYGSWHLLNEGLTCFTNKEYFACLVCLSASIELWLKRTLNSDDELFKLLKKAKTAKIIDNDEYEALNKLREDRNAYVHFDLDKLPKFNEKKTKSVRVESNWTDEEIEKADKLNGEDVEVYPTPAHRYATPILGNGKCIFPFKHNYQVFLKKVSSTRFTQRFLLQFYFN